MTDVDGGADENGEIGRCLVAPMEDDSPPPAVEVTEVWRTFDEHGGVRDLSLRVPAGTIFGLVGPSGSGKTTTVRLLLGAEAPEEGTVSVLGREAGSFTAEDRARIGYLPQLPALQPELSLRHNLQFIASLYGLPWRGRWMPGSRAAEARERIDEVLDFVGLTDNQGTRFRDASGGEQRRLGLAAALVHEPDLLVLDEPTAGIDPLLRERIWERLTRLRDGGCTIFLTTQYVTEAEYCDLVTLQVDGRMVVTDTPDALRRQVFGDGPSNGERFDDVFVGLLQQHRDDGGEGERG